MNKHLTLSLLVVGLVLTGAACGKKAATSPTTSTTSSALTASGNVTDRTDYVINYQDTFSLPIGGLTTHTYIIGRPTAEAATIKKNAFLVPWRIYFSQVQRMTNSALSAACQTVKEQVIYIEGYVDLNLADSDITAASLPNYGPLKPTGTVHETVTGEAGTWTCGDSFLTGAVNQGSVKYVADVSGDHDTSFSDASNLTDLKVTGSSIYLDLTMSGKINLIWPAGAKIEYAPAGTVIPLEPLAPSKL